MKLLIYLLLPLLLSCGNNMKNRQYDKVMIFSSDTSYVNDISWQMDDLIDGFYQDSSKFSIGRAKTMKASRVEDILHDLDHLKIKYYARKNPYIREFNFCKKWQIIFLKQGVQHCAICIDTTSMLMSVKDSIFKIESDRFYNNVSLKDFYPRKSLDQKYYSSQVINIQE
ncbi:hypothetical protein [Sphingobacterium sp. WOUb80]|uniref:hypothetical protein n=1 Tax=Sphingobacterium sp. WOUb80 TaxID=3234028 RepID=UPI003CE72AB6